MGNGFISNGFVETVAYIPIHYEMIFSLYFHSGGVQGTLLSEDKTPAERKCLVDDRQQGKLITGNRNDKKEIVNHMISQ